jgi:transcriptional regulator with XRE-family HTH domain
MARRPLSLPFSGSALRDKRERAGLTIVELAERCNQTGYSVHRTTLGKIERGVHMPHPGLLAALTTALDVTVDDLLDPKVSAA